MVKLETPVLSKEHLAVGWGSLCGSSSLPGVLLLVSFLYTLAFLLCLFLVRALLSSMAGCSILLFLVYFTVLQVFFFFFFVFPTFLRSFFVQTFLITLILSPICCDHLASLRTESLIKLSFSIKLMSWESPFFL